MIVSIFGLSNGLACQHFLIKFFKLSSKESGIFGRKFSLQNFYFISFRDNDRYL